MLPENFPRGGGKVFCLFQGSDVLPVQPVEQLGAAKKRDALRFQYFLNFFGIQTVKGGKSYSHFLCLIQISMTSELNKEMPMANM